MSRLLALAALLIAPAIASAQEQPTVPGSFSTAKKKALREVYAGHDLTFYCNCGFTRKSNGDFRALVVDQCGYSPEDDNVRAHRIEWEHVVPASRMGRNRACWQNKASFAKCHKADGKLRSSRDCCLRVDETSKRMHNDLVNLRPAVGELNADRSDNPFGEIGGEVREYGLCDFEVEGGIAEPAREDRGEIGRTYLYYEQIWGMTLTTDERALFTAWAAADPVDAWEIERNNRIIVIQATGNPLVGSETGEVECRERSSCCRVCGASQACGDACIGASLTCRKAPGCACQAAEVCE